MHNKTFTILLFLNSVNQTIPITVSTLRFVILHFLAFAITDTLCQPQVLLCYFIIAGVCGYVFLRDMSKEPIRTVH